MGIDKATAKENETIKEVMRKIDQTGMGTAFVVNDEKKLVGMVTDGDIRRSILKGINIEGPISKIINKEFLSIKENYTLEDIQDVLIKSNKIYKKFNIAKIPVVNSFGELVNVITENELLEKIREEQKLKVLLKNIEKIPKKILVTGGAGYIGSILVRKLLNKGYKVKVFDNLTYGKESLKDIEKNENFELVIGDIRHIEDVVEAIKDVSLVIHLAGIVGDPACAKNPPFTVETNYLATKMIAEVCKYHQINRFVFASSCSVYGKGEEEVLTEESKLNPVSLYAQDKILSEKALLGLEDENFSPTILRMGTIYGLSHRPRFDLVLNILTANAVVNKKFTVFGGEQWRPMVHVSDAAEAFLKAAEAPINLIKGEVFNVGSNEQNYKIIDLGNTVKKIVPESIIEIKEMDFDKRNYKVKFDKIRNILNFKAEHKIEDGIKEIKGAIEAGIIKNFKDRQYKNAD